MKDKIMVYKIIIITVIVAVLIMILKGYFTRNTSFDVDSAEFEKLMKEPDAVILDVRTASEYNKERIEGAVLLDFNSPSFKDRVKRLRKDRIYLVYCKTGNTSSKACEIMSELGFERCYNLDNGINGWKNNNKPVNQINMFNL